MTEYATLREIALEPQLALGIGLDADADQIVAAIDEKLKRLQSKEGQGGELYRELIEAREETKRLSQSSERLSTELERLAQTSDLERIPAMIVEKLSQALTETARTAAPPAGEPPAQIRIDDHRKAAATKASSDFRHDRSVPLAGLGVIVAAVWGTRLSFGAKLSGVGTTLWSLGAGAIVLGAAICWALAARSQFRDETALRRLYDPEVQERTFDALIERSPQFTRAAFRWRLWKEAVYGTLSAKERRRLPARQEWASRYYDDMRDLHDIETSDNLASGLREPLGPPLPWRRRTQVGNWFSPGKASVLSTVDLDSALVDATDLALARLQQLKVIEGVIWHGKEMYRLAKEVSPPG